MHDGIDAGDASPDAEAIGDRSDDARRRRREHVEPDDLVALLAQNAHQRLAEVTGAAGDENPH